MYSGGGTGGYGVQDAHPTVPTEHINLINDMYTSRKLANTKVVNHTHPCYRFVLLADKYVFSAIYKKCNSQSESRFIYAAVNWLFSADEADQLMSGSKEELAEKFSHYINRSEEILKSNQYHLRQTAIYPQTQSTMLSSDNLQKALTSATYYATKSRGKTNNLDAQVFVGCKEENHLFNVLLNFIFDCPEKMRKYLSFQIGFEAASETYGSSLAITYDDTLKNLHSTDDTMAIKQIYLVDNKFPFLRPPKIADARLIIDHQKLNTIKLMFNSTDDSLRYWDFIERLASNNMPTGAELALLLGEEIFINLLEKSCLDVPTIKQIYSERSKLEKKMPDAIKYLSEIVKTLPPEKSVKIAKAEKEDVPFDKQDGDKESSSGKKKGKKEKSSEKKSSEKKSAETKTTEKKAEDIQDKNDSCDTKISHEPKKENFPSPFRFLLHFYVPALIAFIISILGVATYFFCTNFLVRLSAPWANTVFALNLILLIILIIPLGYVFILSLDTLFKNIHKYKEKAAKKDDTRYQDKKNQHDSPDRNFSDIDVFSSKEAEKKARKNKK